MKRIFDELAVVESSDAVAEGHCRVRFRAPRIAEIAGPGQFVNVKCGGTTLLRRPFSFSRVVGESFDIIVRIIGEGTRRLAACEVGEALPALGPLGHGFEIPKEIKSAVMVGGGCGIGPLHMLGEALLRKDIKTTALLGCQNKRTVPLDPRHLRTLGMDARLAVMEGDGGHLGPVTDLLEQHLSSATGPDDMMVFACGPWGMLKKTAELTKQAGVRCQVLLEEMMGCGMGACMSCACEVVLPGGGTANRKVCTDGPMFWADQVNWNAKR